MRTPPAPAPWTFEVAPLNVWLPALDGDITVRGRTADVDVSIGEFVETLFDDFKFAAMGRFEARKRNLVLTLDLLYLSLEDDTTGPLGDQRSIEFSQLVLEFGMGYQLGTWPLGSGRHPTLSLEVLAGGRYVSFDTELDIAGGGPFGVQVEVDDDVDWIEPFIGARLRFGLSKTLALHIRGDVGGFGIGSDLTWALVGTLQYDISRKVALMAGYRVLDIDYDQGSGTSLFVYDVLTHGPTFGFIFRF
jgi:opacity protein-like surface antigen